MSASPILGKRTLTRHRYLNLLLCCAKLGAAEENSAAIVMAPTACTAPPARVLHFTYLRKSGLRFSLKERTPSFDSSVS
jgi:hypothetical protein